MPKAIMIDGEYPGREYDSGDSPYLIVRSLVKTAAQLKPEQQSVSSVDTRQYTLQCFHTPTKDFLFWTGLDTTPEQVMQYLVDCLRLYNEGHRA